MSSKSILEEAMEDVKILKEQAKAKKILQDAALKEIVLTHPEEHPVFQTKLVNPTPGHDSVTKAYIDSAVADQNWIEIGEIVAAQPMVPPFEIWSTPVVAQTFPMMDIIPWTPPEYMDPIATSETQIEQKDEIPVNLEGRIKGILDGE